MILIGCYYLVSQFYLTVLSDKQTTSSLLKRINIISVNQINAQIKITEIWKAVNNDECPLKITKMKDVKPERRLRSKNKIENNLLECGLTENSKKTFINVTDET